ncbi:MAG: NADH-quinone oxidoreductase subunit L [candidate division Zixibacteria bacterium]|nr:NADH-quinone oxidoreductase subunit L [candidate division Zixibacteria bacterium]
METVVKLIPIYPLIGFLIIGLTNKRLSKTLVNLLACGSVFLSFVSGIIAFFYILGMPEGSRSIIAKLFDWIVVGSFNTSISFNFDPLSAVMVLVVSGVGFLIHVYSIGYMAHDDGYSRYFSYLNLFTFSMLVLVLADNVLLMFVGWEGVGLCSYLLIGFWFHKQSATDAGKKAFIFNRIGDFGFLLAVMLIFWNFGTLNIQEISGMAPEVLIAGGGIATAIGLLLFLGATGKSAQIPLYVWLPDAMEGPTPVSALIHAATMVTAGVYMIARLSAIYVLAPTAMTTVAVIGGLTALFAATIGLVQNDIKRVLAYSTVSQLGYMFLACGVGAFGIAIFHLMTHAFFKALLFLGSGSVIHAMSGEQDMRNMGGLKEKIPHTYKVFLVGTLAISGIPLLSGFFSKDEILWKAFEQGNVYYWLMGVIAAILTAFYMFRLLYMTFYGKSRVSKDAAKHLHESPWVMLLPLYILAVLAIFGGYVGLPEVMGGGAWFDHFLDPVIASVGAHGGEAHHYSHAFEYMFISFSIIAAAIGIIFATMYYIKNPNKPKRLAEKFSGLYKLLLNKYYIDEVYDYLIIKPMYVISLIFWKIFDVRMVDGTVNGVAEFFGNLSERFRVLHTGYVRNYALSFLIGAAALLGYIFLKYK